MTSAELTPLAKSKIKARAAVKGMSLAEVQKLIDNLHAVLAGEKQKEETRAQTAKKAKIAKIKAMMAESGLAPEDLKASARGKGRKKAAKKKAKAKTKAKVAAKYRLVVDGQEHLWSGRGRPPRVFKDYMDAGNSKDSCAI